jgi:hypothetical protein
MNALRPTNFVLIPTTIGAISSWFMIRRACYSWRELLIDGIASGLYPPLSARQRMYVHECTGVPETALQPIDAKRNLGTGVTDEFITREEADFVLDELLDLMAKYGRGIAERVKGRWRDDLAQLDMDDSFLEGLRYFSDIHEDPLPPRGVWGSGDSIRPSEIPPVLRRLSARVQEHHPEIGELRHVYVLHSATGQFFLPPQPLHAFAGHEFHVVPIARKGREEQQGGLVFTVSPSNRSRVGTARDLLQGSWTNKDQDTYAPFRSVLRVHSSARLRCGWGIRPLQYFGHPSNPLPLDAETLTSRYPTITPGSWGASKGAVATPMDGIVDASGRVANSSWWRRVRGLVGRRPNSDSLAQTVAQVEDADTEAALILLAFEGPMDKVKTRNKWKRWEMYAFGEPPKGLEFDRLEEDNMITPEEIGEWYNVPIWMAQNYWSLGRMGAS